MATIYTGSYKNGMPPQPVNIACRPSGEFTKLPERRSIGCLFPGREVWAASKSTPKGDWKAAYLRQLHRHLESGALGKIVSTLRDGDVLMCWEKNPATCHRILAAEFLAAHFPEQIAYGGECSNPKKVARKDGKQLTFGSFL